MNLYNTSYTLSFILVTFEAKPNFPDRFWKIFKYKNSWKSTDWEQSRSMRKVDGITGGQTNMTKLLVALAILRTHLQW